MSAKPKLNLLKGTDAFDVEKLAGMFQNLTGRKPSPEEMDRVRKRLEAKAASNPKH